MTRKHQKALKWHEYLLVVARHHASVALLPTVAPRAVVRRVLVVLRWNRTATVTQDASLTAGPAYPTHALLQCPTNSNFHKNPAFENPVLRQIQKAREENEDLKESFLFLVIKKNI